MWKSVIVPIKVAIAYIIAKLKFPDSINLKKSRLNVEKVVKPPKKPIVKNIFNCSLSKSFVVIK